MGKLITIVQIVISLALIALILIQSRGEGLSTSTLTSSVDLFNKKGIDKIIFITTIISGIIFLIVSMLNILVK